MAAMTEAIRLGTYAGLGILRPFIHMSKGGIAAMGQDLGVDFSRTYSCYKGGAVHCGVCSTCMERREAFRKPEFRIQRLMRLRNSIQMPGMKR